MIDMTITTIVIVTIIITVVIIIVVVKLLNMFENMLKATSTLFFLCVFKCVFLVTLSYSHWYNKHKVAGRSIWASKACVAPGMWSQDRLQLWSEQIGDSW